MHATCVATIQHPKAPRLNTITPPLPPPASHARLFTRQAASAFNQALSFDTSKVTNMNSMFSVRSARALVPTALSRALPVHAACVAATPRPHASRAAPLPTSHARLSTRQKAPAFNQALSFDMSSVTDVRGMFQVRSARALPTPALSQAIPRTPLALPLPHALSPRIACSPLSTRQGSSGRLI